MCVHFQFSVNKICIGNNMMIGSYESLRWDPHTAPDCHSDRARFQQRIAARLRDKQEEKDLIMEPVRSLLYLKTGMSISELLHLFTRVSVAYSLVVRTDSKH